MGGGGCQMMIMRRGTGDEDCDDGDNDGKVKGDTKQRSKKRLVQMCCDRPMHTANLK